MNWKLISIVALGVCHVVLGAVEVSSEAHFKKEARTIAVTERPDDEKASFKAAQDGVNLYKELDKRETEEIRKLTAAAKRDMRYTERKVEIEARVQADLAAYKEGIRYSEKRQDIIDIAENALNSYKSSVDYDIKKSEFEDLIKSARDEYDKKIRLCESMGSDIPEVTAQIRLEAEKAKSKAVSEAEKALKELNSRVDSESRRLTKIKEAELQKLDFQVNNESTRLRKSADKELSVIESECRDRVRDITNQVRSKRTHEEAEAVRNFDENYNELNRQSLRDSARAEDIRGNTPHHERLAKWLNAKKCPKWFVAVVGALPLIPVGYLVYSYCSLLVKVLVAM